MSNIVWSAENGWHDGPECVASADRSRFTFWPAYVYSDSGERFALHSIIGEGEYAMYDGADGYLFTHANAVANSYPRGDAPEWTI